MDPLTHALSGALLARAGAPRRRPSLPLRLHMAAGFGAALFPDIDFALRLFGTLTYLNQHQGITHSLLMLPLWTPLLAVLFALLAGRRGDWRPFLAPVALGLLAHITGDIVTAFGLQAFAPLSAARYALPLAFVIDPVVTLLLVAGLLLAMRAGRAAAIGGLVAVLTYVGFLALQQRSAVAFAEAYAPPGAGVAALPQPFSPFNWLVIVEDGEVWHVARINLRRQAGKPAGSWWPGIAGRMHGAYGDGTPARWLELPRFGREDTAFARQAWQSEAFTPFRNFASFGRLLEITSDETRRCAWFADLRFELPELGPSFRFGACLTNARPDEWELARARGRFWID
ncbi:MAG: metal-dependent hydrolase [Thauera sp.]|nr:metal-dependent hydrolase [Thauera sp.]